jgi:hypothetical protein
MMLELILPVGAMMLESTLPVGAMLELNRPSA